MMMAIDEQELARALDEVCRRHEANALTILGAAARLVASYCQAAGVLTAPTREDVTKATEVAVETFLRALAAYLAHVGAKLQAPPH